MTSEKPTTYKPTPKNILDHTDKIIYVTRYRNLKFYVRMGMIITKLHKNLHLNQSPCLAKYKLCNTKNYQNLKANLERISLVY